MERLMRTHTCAELNSKDIGKTVTLSGWVNKRRDLGGIIFIDLRDKRGITQIVIDPQENVQLHEKANPIRSEWVITITGTVIARKDGMANKKMATGEIEIEAHDIEILSQAKTPPFSICDETIDCGIDLRLKYRYLDMRRGEIAKTLSLRHKAMIAIRNFLDNQEFTEVTTPVLCKSTPEGARDYLVPSRIHPGTFYALPQSPQLFKQLLMIGGLEKYFQICQCFRDEDLRAERQPEFTQVDIEMSCANPEELMKLAEDLLSTLFEKTLDVKLKTPFSRMTHLECVENYGCDKPDLRYDMPLVRLDEIASACEFAVFKETISSGGIVKALCVKGGATLSRREIDGLTAFVSDFGLKGLAWMKNTDEGITGGVSKFFKPDELAKITEKLNGEKGDLYLFAAANETTVNQSLDHLRRHLAKERNLIDSNIFAPLWVTDFPLFEYDTEDDRLTSVHHPFTAPHPDDLHLLETDPLKVRSVGYDIVINGYEVGGGSQRIHNGEMQEKIFQALKISEEEVKDRFGFFVDALKYGTPPHLGIAFGLDRLIMLLAGTDSIRDVIAFPKTTSASDLMMESPSNVDPKQLAELKIGIKS
ncbi:MAG: aspartate--tRNA ligase [Simkaniaceae bacterium]|nr:aspartate--tRNA ligase [Simkaniaceae bacterium]